MNVASAPIKRTVTPTRPPAAPVAATATTPSADVAALHLARGAAASLVLAAVVGGVFVVRALVRVLDLLPGGRRRVHRRLPGPAQRRAVVQAGEGHRHAVPGRAAARRRSYTALEATISEPSLTRRTALRLTTSTTSSGSTIPHDGPRPTTTVHDHDDGPRDHDDRDEGLARCRDDSASWPSVILLLFAVRGRPGGLRPVLPRQRPSTASPLNPRNTTASTLYARGEIVAADGTILAQSVAHHQRLLPVAAASIRWASLTSGVVGFSSPSYGNWGLEAQYDSVPDGPRPAAAELRAAPRARRPRPTRSRSPSSPRCSASRASALAGQDGAAVVLDPRTGAVLAMYSNPNYNPAPLTSTDLHGRPRRRGR